MVFVKLGFRCGTGFYPPVYPLFLTRHAGGLSSLQEITGTFQGIRNVVQEGEKMACKLFLSLKSLLVGAGNLQAERVGVCGEAQRREKEEASDSRVTSRQTRGSETEMEPG